MTDIIVPGLGESVSEATVAQWFKKPGDAVAADEPLVELETDKVTVEVPAPAAGTLAEILAEEGADVEVGAVLGRLGEGSGAAPAPAAAPAPKAEAPKPSPALAPAASSGGGNDHLSPAVRKLIEDNKLDASAIAGTGKDGRILKEDVLAFMEKGPAAAPASAPAAPRETGPREERVKMSRLRRRVAERLKEAQNSAAMLTTFNDVDMTEIMALRNRYKDQFEKKHGVRLGFMGLFAKACVAGLKAFPAVNAEIDGEDIVYKNHMDIGVAVGSEQGLVVPVVRDCEAKSVAQIEADITDFGKRARDGKLKIEEMQGGTFTISNGGVFGSLLSTPILNPPQSGILGMHRTEMRPKVMPDGSIAARPMMYLALSYDHRIIDGREAVLFLVTVKDAIEDPSRLLLDL